MNACTRVREGLGLAASIDNLIEHLSDDDDAVYCAKIGIAASVLSAEGGSSLWVNYSGAKRPVPAETTYGDLFRLIVGQVPRAEIADALRSASFISFNYDRCLEHFLYRSIQAYSGVDNDNARAIVTNIRVVHPYGSLGPLEWVQGGGVRFGEKLEVANLESIAANIRTFSEEKRSEEIELVREFVATAERLIFLGCAPHPQNLALLRPPNFRANSVYATMYMPPPRDPEGQATPPMAEFAAPSIEAFIGTIQTWPREGTSSSMPKQWCFVEPLTSRQLVLKYGSQWTGPPT